MLNSDSVESTGIFHERISDIDITEYCYGFIPAFRDLDNDETHISVNGAGLICHYHSMDNLPIEWVEKWDEDGYPLCLKPSVIAGYMRDGRFYTLFDLVCKRADA